LSPSKFGALLRCGFGIVARRRRQLQHRRGLAFLDMCQKNPLAVRHFQDIVMYVRLILVALPEDRGSEAFEAL